MGPPEGTSQNAGSSIVAADWDHDVAVLRATPNPFQAEKRGENKIAYLRIVGRDASERQGCALSLAAPRGRRKCPQHGHAARRPFAERSARLSISSGERVAGDRTDALQPASVAGSKRFPFGVGGLAGSGWHRRGTMVASRRHPLRSERQPSGIVTWSGPAHSLRNQSVRATAHFLAHGFRSVHANGDSGSDSPKDSRFPSPFPWSLHLIRLKRCLAARSCWMR